LKRRERLYRQKFRNDAGVPAVASQFMEAHGSRVTGGPFERLEYPAGLFMEIDAPVAKALGAYERELHAVIYAALRDEPALFIDIGAAEGYYAVGFASKSPRTTVHAFEIDGWARKRLRRLATANGVADRLVIHAECTPRALLDLPLGTAFVLSDCEGAEVRILTREVAQHLADSTVLVEVHDEAAGQDVAAILRSRFDETHEFSMIERRESESEPPPELSSLAADERRIALEEFRGEAPRWALFSPRRQSPDQS
jgi:precorrin-6B methylase 2